VRVDNAAGIAELIGALVAWAIDGSRSSPAHGRCTSHASGTRLPARPGRGRIEFDERLVVHSGFDRDGGALGVDTLLAGGAPFTAVSCANDLLALGALARLAELGVEVPRDVSVAGFDDISVAAITAPSLSTVQLPLRELDGAGSPTWTGCSRASPGPTS